MIDRAFGWRVWSRPLMLHLAHAAHWLWVVTSVATTLLIFTCDQMPAVVVVAATLAVIMLWVAAAVAGTSQCAHEKQLCT